MFLIPIAQAAAADPASRRANVGAPVALIDKEAPADRHGGDSFSVNCEAPEPQDRDTSGYSTQHAHRRNRDEVGTQLGIVRQMPPRVRRYGLTSLRKHNKINNKAPWTKVLCRNAVYEGERRGITTTPRHASLVPRGNICPFWAGGVFVDAGSSPGVSVLFRSRHRRPATTPHLA